MEAFIQLLVCYGGPGMFVAAFLAGSFFPFSSEVVMVGLLAAGTDPSDLLLWGTAGNTLGSLFNYGVGWLGRDRGTRGVRRVGAWAGLLAWLPLLGSVITVAMGFLRVKPIYAMAAVAVGKYLRYWLLIQAWIAGS